MVPWQRIVALCVITLLLFFKYTYIYQSVTFSDRHWPWTRSDRTYVGGNRNRLFTLPTRLLCGLERVCIYMCIYSVQSVQSLSRVQLCDSMNRSTPGLPVHPQLPELLKLMSIESVMPPNHLILCQPFSSCLQSFPASGSFPMSQFFTPGGQSTGVSASASALPVNIQAWFPLGWTGWISLQSKGLSRVSSNTIAQKHQVFCTQLSQ